MKTSWRNTEDQCEGTEIDKSGNYVIYNPNEDEGEQYYYWLGSTSPNENYGPFVSFNKAEAALRKYMSIERYLTDKDAAAEVHNA